MTIIREESVTSADAAHDGIVAAFTELLRDPRFVELVGWLATVYGVTVRKVEAIDQRSFRTAKERLAAFLARTSGYQASISRATRNGSWRRGSVHPQQEVRGRQDSGTVERLGGRGSGLRGVLEATAAQAGLAPQAYAPGPPLRQGPRMKTTCPACSRPAVKVFNVKGVGLACPGCVRERTKEGLDNGK